MNPRLLLLILALALAGALTWWLQSRRPAGAGDAPPSAAASDADGGRAPRTDAAGADQPANPPLRTAELPPDEPRDGRSVAIDPASVRVDPQTVPARDRVALPDGTWVRPLNDVYGLDHLAWPRNEPWAPIVGIRTEPNGQRWYVHADGSRTTMIMMWRDDLGRLDPVQQRYKPHPELAPVRR
ncbi:MAG: hypothetical protein IPM29_30740 [Planctomycetes bacterium]|nr:hypothetical protein [Planctomycetota bacterium]